MKIINKKAKILFFIIFVIVFGFLLQTAKGINTFHSLNGNLFQNVSSQFKQSGQEQVLIIFNSGGWGNTPPEKAEDFTSVIKGIQNTLNEWGYSSIVVPYNRTKNDFLSKMEGVEEVFNSFQVQSEELANQTEYFLENNPGTKVIIAGLSMGGGFVNETMENLSAKFEVYAIEAGVPFWVERFESENILELDNNKKDILATGQLKTLIVALAKAPGKWFLAKIKEENLTFSKAFQVPGHRYHWSSPEVGPKIISFLKNKFVSPPESL